MRRTLTIILAVLLLVAACGDDDADTTSSTAADGGVDSLTAAEREWCGFAGSVEDSADRFDQVFEAGLTLGLPMDALNAQASALRTEYANQGMSEDDAIRAVFDDLLDDPTFAAACQQAYATYGG